MSNQRTWETAFETAIEAQLFGDGYQPVDGQGFDRERAIFPEEALAFIRTTQPQLWSKLEALHGEQTGARVLEARYQANRVGLTRQLHFSPRSEQSLDVVLSVNGLPVVTLELKNPLTGQTVTHAINQYRQDRDPREPIFVFSKRSLVHFAVDTEEAHMTTRLAGTSTQFLPFNKGFQGSSGNPPDPEGRNYKTAYLWEDVLQRHSLLDLLARFLHLSVEEKTSEQGKKIRKETLIFPRYHQLEAVRSLPAAVAHEGVGHNYLIESSAGSGKSNTIGWLSHRLSSLHDDQDQRLFEVSS